MRVAVLLLSVLAFSPVPRIVAQDAPSIEGLRKALRLAGDQEGSRRYLDLVKSVPDTSVDARAFRASAELVGVAYRSNPLSKYRRFRKWSKTLDRLVSEAPLNGDVRFIRLTVKENTPGFLGYRDGIEDDCAAVMGALSDGYWSPDPEHEAFVTRISSDIDACQ